MRKFTRYPQSMIFAAAIGTPEFDAMMDKYYPYVQSKDIQHLIEMDPTYKEGSNQMGTYGRWILTLANRGPIQNAGHLTDVLTRFESEKKNLKNRDIMKYKSVDEVENMLNDDASYAEQSHRQEVRQRQKDRKNVDLNKDAEKVYEDSEWEVWIPHTYAASCRLGEGTTWCTASTESDYYYEKYKHEYGGDYYIIIMKRFPKNKLQFHFESEQFMNKDDEAVELNEFLDGNRGLRDFFMKLYPIYVLDLDDPDSTTYYYSGGMLPETLYNYIKRVVVSGTSTIDSKAFYGCRNLEVVEIVDPIIETIEDGAFYDCVSLVSINLPEGLVEIDENAFSYCHRLEHIELPSTLTYLGDHAFYECESLKKLDIPGSVELVPYSACNRCTSLETVTLGYGISEIDTLAFANCDSLTNVYIPDTINKISNTAFQYSRHAVIHTDSPVALAYAEEHELKYKTNLDDGDLATL